MGEAMGAAIGAAISKALYGHKQRYYNLRVPVNSEQDRALRPAFGNIADGLTNDQWILRKKLKYRGAGMYMGQGKYRRTGRGGGRWRTRFAGKRRYRGRGGYWMQTLFGAKPGGFWDRAGDAVADAADAATGGATGLIRGGAQALHRMYKGTGAYQSNSLVDEGAAVPGFNDVPDGNSVVISHREYISDVYGPNTNTFTNVAYEINPGLERTFPWLSQIACNYDEYTIQQLMFTYRPTVTEFAAASGQQGQIIMATQYNAADAPFTDKRVMMQYDGAMSSKVSCEQVHGVECNPAKLSGDQGKYIRNRPVLQEQDINTYDHGKFNIAIADIPTTYNNQSIGELWVSYTIELRKPKFYSNKGLAITKDIFAMTCREGPAQIMSQMYPFGDAGVGLDARLYGQQNTLGSRLDLGNSVTNINPPTGSPQITASCGNILVQDPATLENTSFAVTLPSYWAGALEINFDELVAKHTLNGSVAPCQYRLYTTGNITPIFDLFAINNTGAISVVDYIPATTAISIDDTLGFGDPGKGTCTLTQKWHIRVAEANQGIENKLYFVRQSEGEINQGVVKDSQVSACMLTLTEYNTGFNYKPDGGNDDILFVNKNGVLTAPFV